MVLVSAILFAKALLLLWTIVFTQVLLTYLMVSQQLGYQTCNQEFVGLTAVWYCCVTTSSKLLKTLHLFFCFYIYFGTCFVIVFHSLCIFVFFHIHITVLLLQFVDGYNRMLNIGKD